MKLYLDTEFNGYQGELISMALVGEGREFYEVLECRAIHFPRPWVREHVIPVLGKKPIKKMAFLSNLEIFLNQFIEVEIVADWPDDIKYFCEALVFEPGKAIKTPPLTFYVIECEYESAIPHNALEDAKAIMTALS